MGGACEEPNDALICYRRTDRAFAEALGARLAKNYFIHCFRDEEGHKYGSRWRPCWRQQLDIPVDEVLANDLGPTVIVLATEAALQPRPDKDIMVEEIWEALTLSDRGLSNPIVVLGFGGDGWAELVRRLQAKAVQECRPDLMEKLHSLHNQHQPFDPAMLQADLTDRQWDDICRPVVAGVRSYFLRILREERRRTESWAADILGRRLVQDLDHDFSAYQSSRRDLNLAIGALVLSNKRSLVAVAEGGMGKTTQVAQSLLSLLRAETNYFFPIVLTNDDLNDVDGMLRDRFGLKWIEKGRPVSLHDEGLSWARDRLCFVVDSLERADDVEVTAGKLDRLRSVAKLLITSRTEAWSRAKEQLSLTEADLVRLEAINGNDVAKCIGINNLEEVRRREYLCNPVFLDIAVYLVRENELQFEGTSAANETQLLDRFKQFSTDPWSGLPASEMEQARKKHEDFLIALARRQLDESRFDVSYSALCDAGYKSAIKYLTDERPYALIEGSDAARKRIRLRHDIIDSHNLSDLVMRVETDRFQQALGIPQSGAAGKLHLGFGQVMFEGVMQAAYDRKERDQRYGDFIREFFLEFLRLVDNKGVSESAIKAAGWNSGYVISAQFSIFRDLIDRSLAGGYLGNAVPSSKVERLSDIDSLTQNALSSVSSMFGALRPLSLADPDGSLLQTLARHIRDPEVSLKGRLIEAIAKIDRPDDVVRMLADLASDAALINNDVGLVRYIARAMRDVARGARDHLDAIQEALKRLQATFRANFSTQFPSVHRDIEEAERAVATIGDLPLPPEMPFTTVEFVEGLSTLDPLRPGQYSDWIIVDRYLGVLERPERRRKGPPPEAVIMAVGRCLWHYHSRCHESAAHTLGLIDHPFARGLLLHVLTFESGDGIEAKLIEALTQQQRYLKAAPERAIRFRLALQRALAVRHRLIGYQRVDELLRLLEPFEGLSDPLVTEQFIELQRFHHAIPLTVEESEAPIADLPPWMSDAERQRDVGEEKEAKIAFRIASGGAAAPLRYARSSWQQPRRLHVALLERDDYFRRLPSAPQRPVNIAPSWEVEESSFPQSERTERTANLEASVHPEWKAWKEREPEAFTGFLEAIVQRHAIFESGTEVPSIATLHCIVMLSDGCLVEARRSDDSDYAPGRWAASFEEQVKLEDVGKGDGLVRCCMRGLQEEFGVTLARSEIIIEAASLGIEWQLLNNAVMVVARLALDSFEFQGRGASGIRDCEVAPPTCESLAPRLDLLERSRFGTWYDKDRRPSHPTSVARLALIRETALAEHFP